MQWPYNLELRAKLPQVHEPDVSLYVNGDDFICVATLVTAKCDIGNIITKRAESNSPADISAPNAGFPVSVVVTQT